MSIAQTRGGFPFVLRKQVPTSGFAVDLPGTSMFVRFHTDSACRFYFKKEHYDADTNYAEVPTADASQLWEGPAEVTKVWMRAVATPANVELVAFLRLN